MFVVVALRDNFPGTGSLSFSLSRLSIRPAPGALVTLRDSLPGSGGIGHFGITLLCFKNAHVDGHHNLFLIVAFAILHANLNNQREHD